MRWIVAALVVAGCGDDAHVEFDAGPRDAAAVDSPTPMGFFGEPCTVAAAGVVVLCHGGEGACNEEGGVGVCRPFCYTVDIPQTETCKARGGQCVTASPSGVANVCVP